ncbi:hypothetical protein H0H93_009280 [Arthromyces matolae]|nr:hypothetical protein H0H93_009280 [Arthromyces matolae]
MTSFSPVNGDQWHIPTFPQGIVLVASIVSAFVYLFSKAVRSRRLTNEHGDPIPDGPWGLPVVGSFPFLTHFPELTLDYWAKKFGPLYSMWLGNQLFVVISDPHIVKDLMVTNRTPAIEDPLVGTALRLSREFMNTTGPVSNLTDFIPLLQRIPNYMTSRGKKLHSDLVETYGGFLKDIEAKLKRGEPVPDCLAKTMLTAREEEELDDTDMAILASAFMIGGVETTASIMQWFSALIPAYPEIQAKAHAELDRVVGRGRLPTVEDEKNLPYIHAIIKPERYVNDCTLSSESANLADPYERDHWMFGVGRRICPGMWVAEREVFLVISRMLWAFKMEEIADEPIDLKEYDGLSGRSPVYPPILV